MSTITDKIRVLRGRQTTHELPREELQRSISKADLLELENKLLREMSTQSKWYVAITLFAIGATATVPKLFS